MSRQYRDELEFEPLDVDGEVEPERPRLAPGRRTLTQLLPARTPSPAAAAARRARLDALWGVPARTDSAPAGDVAAAGVAGPGAALPYLDTLQRAFGPDHDLSAVRAHVGGPAATAARAIGARAYATGNDVAFDGEPDLHTAAHEAAHVVQQRGGVQLAGGIGEAGDRYERHADAVADAVVRGESAAELLADVGGSASAGGAVQRKERSVSAVIVGHSSPRWEQPGGRKRDELNLELSEKRAHEVRRRLQSMFEVALAERGSTDATDIDCTVECNAHEIDGLIEPQGHGKTIGEASGDTNADGRELRRVELFVTVNRVAAGEVTSTSTHTETTPRRCTPNRTRDWAVKVKANTGVMVGYGGVSGAYLQIKNRLTGQEVDYVLPMAGGGIGIGTTGGADPGWGKWSDFRTRIPATFEDFDLAYAEIEGVSITGLFSVSVKALNIPGLGVQGVNVSGLGVGGFGGELSKFGGVLLGNGDLPDEACTGPTTRTTTKTRTESYEYTMPTQHRHVVYFPLQGSHVDLDEALRLQAFAEELADYYDEPLE